MSARGEEEGGRLRKQRGKRREVSSVNWIPTARGRGEGLRLGIRANPADTSWLRELTRRRTHLLRCSWTQRKEGEKKEGGKKRGREGTTLTLELSSISPSARTPNFPALPAPMLFQDSQRSTRDGRGVAPRKREAREQLALAKERSELDRLLSERFLAPPYRSAALRGPAEGASSSRASRGSR